MLNISFRSRWQKSGFVLVLATFSTWQPRCAMLAKAFCASGEVCIILTTVAIVIGTPFVVSLVVALSISHPVQNHTRTIATVRFYVKIMWFNYVNRGQASIISNYQGKSFGADKTCTGNQSRSMRLSRLYLEPADSSPLHHSRNLHC